MFGSHTCRMLVSVTLLAVLFVSLRFSLCCIAAILAVYIACVYNEFGSAQLCLCPPYSHISLMAGAGRGKDLAKKKGGKAKGGKSSGKGICFEMRDQNACSRGDSCRYSHDREEHRTARRELQQQQQAVVQQQQQQQQQQQYDVGWVGGGRKGKGRGKGKGKKGKKGGGSQRSSPATTPRGGQNNKKNKLCRFIKEGNPCPNGGENCQCSHSRKKFDENGKLKSNANEASVSSAGKGVGEWAPPPGKGKPQMAFTVGCDMVAPNPFGAGEASRGPTDRSASSQPAAGAVYWRSHPMGLQRAHWGFPSWVRFAAQAV